MNPRRFTILTFVTSIIYAMAARAVEATEEAVSLACATLRRILETGFKLFIRTGIIIGVACLIASMAVPNLLRVLPVI